MKHTITIFIVILLANTLAAKEQDCKCIHLTPYYKEIPDTIIRIADHFSFAICGSIIRENETTYFSHFVMSDCENGSYLEGDTHGKRYLIQPNADTMMLTEMMLLPTGKNLQFQFTPWVVRKAYLSFDSALGISLLYRNGPINTILPNATKSDIQEIKQKLHGPNKINSQSDFIGLLFYGAISGDTTLKNEFLKLTETIIIDTTQMWHYIELKKRLFNTNYSHNDPRCFYKIGSLEFPCDEKKICGTYIDTDGYSHEKQKEQQPAKYRKEEIINSFYGDISKNFDPAFQIASFNLFLQGDTTVIQKTYNSGYLPKDEDIRNFLIANDHCIIYIEEIKVLGPDGITLKLAPFAIKVF